MDWHIDIGKARHRFGVMLLSGWRYGGPHGRRQGIFSLDGHSIRIFGLVLFFFRGPNKKWEPPKPLPEDEMAELWRAVKHHYPDLTWDRVKALREETKARRAKWESKQ